MPNTIIEAFKKFTQYKVLIIGDIMIDSYMWGKVDRISPEAPVPVLHFMKSESRLGGAANLALNIQALGGTPILCSVIGKDSGGNNLLELLKEKNIRKDGVLSVSERTSTIKNRIISGGQQLLRVDRENDSPIPEETEQVFIKKIIKIIDSETIDVIIFEDYDKGTITPNVITAITEIAKEKSLPVFVDPKHRNFRNYNYVTFFKPNFKEITEGLEIHLDKNDMKGLARAAKFLHSVHGIQHVMITLSEKGIFYSSRKSSRLIAATIRNIADVSGAGDTVIAVAAMCYVAGLDIQHVAAIANLAGGQVCEKVGVVPVDKEQLLEESLRVLLNS